MADPVIPPFVPPPERAKEPGTYVDEPLKIRYVKESIDWTALFINIFSLGFLFILMHLILSIKTDNPLATLALPLSLLAIPVVLLHHRFWTSPRAQTAHVYMDNIQKKITVYLQGFHFIPWFSTKEGDEINFQIHEVLKAKREDKTSIVFPSMDGFELAADVTILLKRRDTEEALSRSLKFQMSEINTKTLAEVRSRLSEAGGLHSYATLLKHKSDVAKFVAKIFGGENTISDFETITGTTVSDPILDNLGLTEESAKTYGVKAKVDVFKDAVMGLTDKVNGPGIPAEEASLAAQAVSGAATRVINTNEYKGVPPNVTVFAPGGGNIAIKGGK